MDSTENINSYHFLSAPYCIDRKLYKYYSNLDYAIDCIQNRRIHLDNPRTFNDPFDAVFSCYRISILTTTDTEAEAIKKLSIYILTLPKSKHTAKHEMIIKSIGDFIEEPTIEVSFEQIERPVIQIIKKLYDALDTSAFSLDEFIEEIDLGFAETERVMQINCRISCFSEVKDSILMWSYYGQNHRGICIEFDLEKLDNTNELNQLIIKNMSRVHYSPLRADKFYPFSENSGLNFLTTKADVWKHEFEWRLICETEEEYLPFDCISGIYLGVNFSSKDFTKLAQAINTHEYIPVYRGKLSLDKYEIDYEEDYSFGVFKYLNRNKES